MEIEATEVGDLARAVLSRTDRHDLVVVGLNEPFLRRFGPLAVPEIVAKRSPIPLVVVKAARGLGAMTRRFI